MSLSRREFLKATAVSGGGLMLSFSLGGCAASDNGYRQSDGEGRWTPNAWLEITDQNGITLTIARVEMGQGTVTGMTTLVAEELDVPPDTLQTRFAPVGDAYRNPLYKLQLTGGSTSLATSWQPLREAGAAARIMLERAAARTWNVEARRCTGRDGRVWHPDGQTTLTYGQLAALAAHETVPDPVPLRPQSDWRYIGKTNTRHDAEIKSTGQAEYGIDVDLPDMVYAVMTRPPRLGLRVDGFNANTVRAMPGVIDVVETERGVAVVADKYWRARKAQDALEIVWDETDALDLDVDRVFEIYARAADDDSGETEREDGDVEQARSQAGQVLEAEYRVPFLAHATMEPMNATARVNENGIEVWAPTQAPDLGRIAAARVTDFSPDEVTIHTTWIGGGFGRRLTQDYIEEVAAIAFQVRRPVKLLWSREDDMRHDVYRPAMLHRLSATLSDEQLTGWDHQIVGPQVLNWYARNAAAAQFPWAPKFLYDSLARVGVMAEGIATPKDTSAIEGAVEYPYAAPNVRVRHTHVDAGIPISYWRSVGHSHNGFVVETFMDEIAHSLGRDSYAFRRDLLKQKPGDLAVLDRAAKLGDWSRPVPEGRARGIAIHRSFGTLVAQVVEAGIEGGAIRVYRVACVVDCGQVVNPDVVRMQMESGIMFGLTAALYGEIEFEQGAVKQGNFDDYRLLSMYDLPEMTIDIIDSEALPTGVGEPGVPPVMPALGNALFALTGKRQRSMPFKVEV
ncbi:xanthine dehydrogenase family protein molybdopterin-binding subunit [Marinobacter sp. R17]|uniref:xanthine dehydrogenase family protein molybdopterin-binding subunit n=1 Tax=Marinobacter sp. R17 TaxID=2484250 RepID=UPI000F4B4F48|nr:molybdopterin cofactor-binding domain-containing protein [Marinobacter sp. R17]ROT98304.1 xanthine dehydrogenase family protein molybdopterin-binding subunit [Marinobacter sp. R17]